MNKIKNLFSTPKKAALTIVCIVAVLAAVTVGTIRIAQAFAESSSIGADNAKNFAFADAGVDPVAAKNVRVEFDFEQGQFVYEVEFTADGTEYEYWIKASDGTVVKKQQEIVTADGKNAVVSAKITMDEAKEKALADAGLKISEVTFTKEKLDLDNGISVYELDFYAGNTEYEYEIYADSGDIYSKSREPYNGKPAQSPSPAPEATKQPQGTGSAGQTQPSGDTGNAGQTQPSQDNTGSAGQTQPSGGTSDQGSQASGQIGLDAAKNIALSDAGVSASQANFTKAKLDHDDGTAVYDIEFYTSEREYEYEIHAANGTVLDRSVEALEHNESHRQDTSGSQSSGSQSSGGQTSQGSYISVDQAKAAAVGHAGFSVSDVNFKKAKLENDDGYTIYEIEFYKNGTEYEYKINAATGAVLEYETETDD